MKAFQSKRTEADVIDLAFPARASVGEFFDQFPGLDIALFASRNFLSVAHFCGQAILQWLRAVGMVLACIAPALGSELVIETVSPQRR